MTPFLWGLLIGVFVGAAVGWIGLSLVACGGRADLDAENAKLRALCMEQSNLLGEGFFANVRLEKEKANDTQAPAAL